MYIDVPWDTGTIPVRLDPDRLAGMVEAKTVKVRDEAALLRAAVTGPDGRRSLAEFLAQGEGPILFLVNDATRPTPSGRVLEILSDQLEGQELRFLVATGAHRRPGEADLEQIFGRLGVERWLEQIDSHDARDQSTLAYLGDTPRGTPIWLNRAVLEASRLVLLNSVEPHYFAGFTGGRKSIFPGVAGFATIEGNHKLALDPDADLLALAGNPVHEDMLDMMRLLADKDIFSIQMVLDRQHRIHAVSAGGLEESFADAVHHAEDHYVVDVPARADIVVAVAAYPMDYDLYQSQKAMENGALALAPGGILILVSKCRHGIGDDTFFNLLASQPTPQAVLDSIAGQYKLGYHKAARLAHIALKGEMWGVTGIPPDELDAAFIRPFPDVQAAVDAALHRKGPQAKMLVLTDGSVTVPRVRAAVPVPA